MSLWLRQGCPLAVVAREETYIIVTCLDRFLEEGVLF